MSLENPGLKPTETGPGDPSVVDAPTAPTTAGSASSNGGDPTVTMPSNGAGRRLHGRAARSTKAKPGRRRARKVQRIVRRIEPWSVLKISLLFYFCLFLILLVAGTLLWTVGRSAGVIDDVEGFISDVGFGECERLSDLPPGREFVRDTDCLDMGDDYVRTGGQFEFEDRTLLSSIAVGGLILVIAGSAANVLLAVLFNLISDLTGGIRMTVLQEQRAPRAAPVEAGSSSAPPNVSSVPGPSG
jgi:hypothetical protein